MSKPTIPSDELEELRDKIEEIFGKRGCWCGSPCHKQGKPHPDDWTEQILDLICQYKGGGR